MCLQFGDPVPALDPFGLIRHPDPTVTITDPAGLIDIMKGRATIPEVHSAASSVVVVVPRRNKERRLDACLCALTMAIRRFC